MKRSSGAVVVACSVMVALVLSFGCGRPPSDITECQPGSGDVNLDGKASSVADAVVLTRFFTEGISAFVVDKYRQVAASDVNGDCIAPALADLIYMIHLIAGDAKPVSELVPVVATYQVDTSVVSVDISVVKTNIVVEGMSQATLLVDSLSVSSRYDTLENITRILVHSWDMKHPFNGPFVKVSGIVLSADFATYDGASVVVRRRSY
jgi:hypothetical protein